MIDTSSYIIQGGVAGRERLRVLARVMAPGTNALLDRLGSLSGLRCLDAGCGGGDVTQEAKLITPFTMENIAEGVTAAGLASAEEVALLARELYAFAADETTMAGMPRVVQAWGRAPLRAGALAKAGAKNRRG